MKRIIQFVAGFSHGDAISNEAVVMRDLFRSWGYESHICSEAKRILAELRKEALDVDQYRSDCRPDDIVILHLSIGSVMNDVFAELPCRKAILYHNITPPEFLEGVQPQIARHLAKGREQLKRLAGSAGVVMADSTYNAQELNDLGYGETHVLPLVLDLSKIRSKPHRGVMKKFDDELTNILFVGRCVPNKRLEDLLSAFHYYQQFVNPASRLIHAGSWAGTEQYQALLVTFARELGLQNCEFTGSIRQDELNACYRSADIFLSMSEHEGFCIPLLEAMAVNVPVMAYEAGAVAETMDGAGILFREKQFDQIAEMIGQVVRNSALRQGILEGQQKRVQRYESRSLDEELQTHLHPLLS